MRAGLRRRDLLRAVAGTAGLGMLGAGESAAQSTDLSPLGSVSIDGAYEAVVSHNGRRAYVAATDGFVTVSLADPSNPRVLAERRDLLADRPEGPLDGIHDVSLDGDRLLVVGPASSNYESLEAAVVFDVSDPRAPRRVSVHTTDGPIHNGYLAGGVAYLCVIDAERDPLVLVDSETGVELGRWSLPVYDAAWADVPPAVRPIHDVYVQDGRAYAALWDAGTWVLDVREPAVPTVLGSVGGRPPSALLPGEIDTGAAYTELPGNHHYSAVDDEGSLLAVGKEAWDDPSTEKRGGPGGITLWNVSDPTAPRRLATISPPSTPDPTREGVWTHAHNFEFVGEYLYTSWFRGGVKVYDVSEPTDPRAIAAWRAGSGGGSGGGGLFSAERASFWTARMAVPGSFFIASAWGGYDGSGDERLFTFPDPATHRSRSGRSANVTTTTGPGSAGGADGAGKADSPTAESSSPSNASPSSSPAPSRSSSSAPPSEATNTHQTASEGNTAVEGPGFGLPAAASALGVLTWRALRAGNE